MRTPIKGFDVFTRTNSAGHWNIASWHSPHSLTWRWILCFSRQFRAWPLWWSYRTNYGLNWGVRLPWIGYFTWQPQHPMWYRDLYWRREEEQRRSHYDAMSITPPPQPPLDIGSHSVH